MASRRACLTVLAIAGVFIGIGVIGLTIHFTIPEQVKEARKMAREVILKRMVRCDICDNFVSFEDYSSHIKQYHPKKVPYEWYRTALFVLLVLVGGGGYIVLSILAEMEALSAKELMLFVISWIAGSCLIFFWVMYEYHVGEPKHLERMRRRWGEHRFDSEDSKNE